MWSTSLTIVNRKLSSTLSFWDFKAFVFLYLQLLFFFNSCKQPFLFLFPFLKHFICYFVNSFFPSLEKSFSLNPAKEMKTCPFNLLTIHRAMMFVIPGYIKLFFFVLNPTGLFLCHHSFVILTNNLNCVVVAEAP